MSCSTTWRTTILTSLTIAALAACGGSPSGSPVGPGSVTGDDGAVFTTLGNGGAATPAGPGDSTCDGTGPGDGTCDGTGQGPGPHGGQGNGPGYGPGNGTGNGACEGGGPGPGDGTCDGACGGAGQGPGDGTCVVVGTDPDDLQGLLVEALQEEHLAEVTYRRVLADFGSVAPFARIADSEAQHVQAILRLFGRRGWSAPESLWTLGNVPVFGSVAAACAGAVAVEIEDGALYEGYLSRDDLPSDVVNVFTRLQAASLDNHLPAFQACQ